MLERPLLDDDASAVAEAQSRGDLEALILCESERWTEKDDERDGSPHRSTPLSLEPPGSVITVWSGHCAFPEHRL